MLREKQKIVRLLDELLNYSLRCDPQKVTITIEDLGERVQITLDDSGVQLDAQECQHATQFLNAPCRNEMREYYSGLAGEETLSAHNLRIVGMMVDGGVLENSDGGTRLSVWWKPE